MDKMRKNILQMKNKTFAFLDLTLLNTHVMHWRPDISNPVQIYSSLELNLGWPKLEVK